MVSQADSPAFPIRGEKASVAIKRPRDSVLRTMLDLLKGLKSRDHCQASNLAVAPTLPAALARCLRCSEHSLSEGRQLMLAQRSPKRCGAFCHFLHTIARQLWPICYLKTGNSTGNSVGPLAMQLSRGGWRAGRTVFERKSRTIMLEA